MKKLLSILLSLVLLNALAVFGLPVRAADPMSNEVIELRNQYSNTYYMNDGTFSTRISIESINYEIEDGNFLPIQTGIVPSSKSGWDWEVETGHWQLYINNDMMVRVVKDSNEIGHVLYGIAYYNQASKEYSIIQTVQSQTPTVIGNTITWTNVLYGVDYRLTYTNDSLKEDIIIRQECRDWLNTPGYTPVDYGMTNPGAIYITPIFRMDWSNSLPMKFDNGVGVNRGNSEHEQVVHFESPTKDKYFNTNLVSYMPIDYAMSVNPINPDDPEEEWEYSNVKMRKRMVTDEGGDWLLAGIKFFALNSMPDGDIIFDPTETFRPNAAGDVTTIPEQYPDSTFHWDKVDEASADDAGTYVRLWKDAVIYSYVGNDKYDLYNIPDSAVAGTTLIHYVQVYSRSDGNNQYYQSAVAYEKIKTHGTEYESDAHNLLLPSPPQWETNSHQWTTNPYTDVVWTWDEVDALQIGVRLKGQSAYEGSLEIRCTQVYVEVSYSVVTVPIVTTQAATNIETTTATYNGNITHTGYDTPTMRGFVWDTTSYGDPGDTAPGASDYSDNLTEHGSFSTGAFTGAITGLIQGDTYYYRAFAYNSEGYSYGDEVFFITDDVPIVVTNAATNVAYTTARVNSMLTSDGGEECDIRFQYYEDGNPAWGVNTTWVEGYTTGQQPYVDLADLTFATLHHFRVQAKNTYGTVNGTSLDFTTENSVLEPTNLKAFPEAESVALSWTKGGGSTNTLIRYKEGAYPTTTSDGTQAYFDTSSSYSVTGLTSGHTYYISTWGHSGVTYSENYTTVMATTLAFPTGGDVPDAPPMPPTWFQTPDYTNFAALPFYDIINAFFDAYEMPRASGWFFSAISGCIVFAILVFVLSKHPMPAMIALAVAIAMASLIKLLPMFMLAFTVIFMLGAFQLGRAK